MIIILIAVASGKGGTGKTTVSTSLALCSGKCTVLDCDVEEPNSHLYLSPELADVETVCIPTPVIDEDRCTHCSKCSSFCEYNALAVLPSQVLVFPAICNGCGGCSIVCPENAVSEKDRVIGHIQGGKAGDISFFRGLLTVGEARSVPIIRSLKTHAAKEGITILDSPPGSSCPVVETLEGVDYVILVTEPTPFGIHDMDIVVSVVRDMGIPCGVVINKDGIGSELAHSYIESKGLTLLASIPHSMKAAKSGSNAVPIVEAIPELKERFEMIIEKIGKEVGK